MTQIPSRQLVDTFEKCVQEFCEKHAPKSTLEQKSITDRTGRHLVQFDIIRTIKNEPWFCFSIILDDEGNFGFWKRSDFDRTVHLHEVERNCHFKKKEFKIVFRHLLENDDELLNEMTRDRY